VRRIVKPLFEIPLRLAQKGARDAQRNLVRQLREAIVDGRLPLGARLPSTREARARFGVARNTLAEVYDRLLNEGYVVARQGAGTFVADELPKPPARDAKRASLPPRRMNDFWLREDVAAALGFWREHADATQAPGAAAIDLRPAIVDSRLFPFDVLRRLMAAQLRAMERKPSRLRSPFGNQGNFMLRDAIRRHIALTRAVACDPDEVIVTAGAQQAFDLLARVLVIPGETVVAIEDPGYPPMRVAFAAAGAKLVPVGVDAQGLIVDDLPRNTGIVCLCPSHQFPLGATLSPARRAALIAFAHRHGAVIVEDDYDGEFRHDGTPVAALRAPEAADVVFYVGTFSKCMLPALRLGFVVAPHWSLPALVAAKNALDWHCPIPTQLGVGAFIAEGHLTHHVRKMRQLYKQRREWLLRALTRDFGEWLEVVPSLYGMHVGVLARADVDADALADGLARRQVRLHSLRRYFLATQVRQGLVFGFGTADQAQLRQALHALQDILRQPARNRS
jgi:GntR family transcriptional regulator/MocR family aminotransferase